ncbi:type II toxin-antitoxin system RelE/ParE family toxin [Flavobacterium pectinovorum]|uniref:Type II toxin-antitoxin system RelE/ParE family toxin n=1 Tax=Flavobacterium pectinovorum TaxID=29533 RepID=A0A502E2S2_9FLAO|nr:type II toxin-antitoxin system RelE/ParE family toxin [Flavobacterium pectinovorum]TPG31837.1 type II toxin-antitoxin system RelE/ParE family toxin [Flavobacterium pectinovorum]
MYNIKIDQDALNDLKEIVIWYNNQVQNLGLRFHKQVKSQINTLKNQPYICNIRYEDMRCMLVKKFPFMIHYKINDESYLVEIFAVFHTSRHPEIWNSRIKK